MSLNRRQFLQLTGGLASRMATVGVGGTALLSLGCNNTTPYGQLQPADANGIMLPPGFSSRIVAVSQETVPNTSYTWPNAPDGGAVFPTSDGWIYVANAESFADAGASALRFDQAGNVIDAYRILGGTLLNCAGGATPWGTWLSCEEIALGLVHECDPTGVNAAVARPAMGSFKHEAVACDPVGRCLYMTEDFDDGGFYRFTPDVWSQLDSGLLEVAEVSATNQLIWHEVPNPNPDVFGGGETPTRQQVPQAAIFDGGEGIIYDGGHIYFSTKGDNRVWDLDLSNDVLSVLYDAALFANPVLTGVDNLGITRDGDIIVAEDGGNMELVSLGTDGVAQPLLRVLNQDTSELTGPSFDPWGTRLYFSSQRGPDFKGVTYEVTGPFRL